MDVSQHKLLSFLALNDTPNSYVGQGGLFIKVKVTEDGLEFGVGGGGGAGTVDTANSPNAGEFARFTDADTIEGRTAAETRSDLGLVIGTNIQAWSSNLDEYAAVNPTAAGLALLDDADTTAQLVTLGFTSTITELNYTDGVTSSIQTQLDAKAPLASPALTGNPTAPTQAAGDNSTKIATTAYADAAVATAVTGLLDFKGSTDASLNPNYPAASKGDAYVVSVAGKIGGGSGKSVDVGDVYVASADNAGGTEAAVGTSWFVLEHNLVGALLAANNLSDLTNTATALTNLGFTASITELNYTDGVTSAIQTQLDGKQPLDADLTTLSTVFTSASASGSASLALHEDTDNGTNKITLIAPASIASDKTVTFQDITGTVYVSSGTDVSLADGGTGSSLVDPNDDQIMMWDDSAGAVVFMDIGTGLSIDATPILSVDQATAFAWTAAHTWTKAGLTATFTNSTDGASSQVAIFQGDRATMADNDEAYLSLKLSDDGGTQVEFARNTWVATDVNVGTSLDGEYRISVIKAGSLTQIGAFKGTGLDLLASGVLSFGAVSILSDSAGTTTLSNIDALDATTESTIEAAIDTLANLTSIQGQTVTFSAPFTVPADPNADSILFWDDSAGATTWLTLGTNLSITGTTLNATGTSGATTALDNLASVAINAALVLGTSDAFALGSTTKQWADLFLAEGGVINWDNGDVTLTQTGNLLALAGGQFSFGANTAYFTETDNGNSSTADTIDWTLSNKQKSTLTGNVTYTFTAPGGPCNLVLKVIQGAGPYTITWPAAVLWPGNIDPIISTGNAAVDIFTFYYDGTNYYGLAAFNFS